MTKRQENFFTMLKELIELLTQNVILFASVSAFPALKARLVTYADDITAKNNLHKTLTAGKTADKNKAEKELIKRLLVIAAALKLYASSAGNEEVKEISDVTKSGLMSMRDTDLLGKAKKLNSLSGEHAESLTGYNIDEAKRQALADAVTAYEAALGVKGVSFADKKAVKKELNQLFKDVKDVLNKELDDMVVLIKNEHPAFFEKYKNVRKVKHLGIRHKPPDTEGDTGE